MAGKTGNPLRQGFSNRDRFKARTMKCLPVTGVEVGKNCIILAQSLHEKENPMPDVKHINEEKELRVGVAEIQGMALRLARELPKKEGKPLLRKLKSINARFQGARNKPEVQYIMAKAYPRLDDKSKEAIKFLIENCWKDWPLKDVKQVFSWMTVFFEAKTGGFPLEG